MLDVVGHEVYGNVCCGVELVVLELVLLSAAEMEEKC